MFQIIRKLLFLFLVEALGFHTFDELEIGDQDDPPLGEKRQGFTVVSDLAEGDGRTVKPGKIQIPAGFVHIPAHQGVHSPVDQKLFPPKKEQQVFDTVALHVLIYSFKSVLFRRRTSVCHIFPSLLHRFSSHVNRIAPFKSFL